MLTDEQLTPVLDALQRQVTEQFAPIWRVNAQLVQVCKKPLPNAKNTSAVMQVAAPPARSWWLVVANTSDFAGAEGYHDVTPEGLPLAKAFIKSDVDAGRPWSVTLSHELLEMLADPDISTCIEYQGSKKRVFFSLEICDPCQDDKFAYFIGQILVSDFVLPGFYHAYRNYPFYDWANHIKKPLQILEGGYMSVFDPTLNQGWRDVGANQGLATGAHARQRVGSRRERRTLPRAQWEPSQPATQFAACKDCGNQVVLPADKLNGFTLATSGVTCDDCKQQKESK